MNIASINKKSINSFYIVYLLFGIQLISFVPTYLNASAQIFLWFANIISFALSLIIILTSLDRIPKSKKVSIPLLIFLILYSLRMMYDLFINRIYTNTFPNPTSYLIYLYGLCLLPALAIFCMRQVNYDWVLKWSYTLLAIIILLSLANNLIFGNIIADEDVGETSLRAGANKTIGALAFGHLGVSFSILSFYRYMYQKKSKLFLSGIALGIIVIFMSGSRSPLISLFISVYILIAVRKGFFKIAFITGLVVLPLVAFWDNIINFFSTVDNKLIYRLVDAIKNKKYSGRDILYEQVIKQINNSPFFGDAFLVTEGKMKGFYPHNIILESLMVTGVFGTIFLFIWIYNIFKKGFIVLKDNQKHGWIFLLFLQFFAFGLFSKSFYTNQNLWYYSFLLLNYYWVVYENNKSKKNSITQLT
ncbi:O-antigen ligase family protein [Chryseobacterium taichungense]|uniref:O-antigen ligase family protein n=1 Tax=Chryseobacterium taichungense TaxID=295069 RepID=UPI0028A6B175|nr:O-antigen ligase family protein [Chryseobacterium taichungense]